MNARQRSMPMLQESSRRFIFKYLATGMLTRNMYLMGSRMDPRRDRQDKSKGSFCDRSPPATFLPTGNTLEQFKLDLRLLSRTDV
jgi:hypothetical protein